MDPRHPEQAIPRMRELMKQYDRIEADIAKATTSVKLAQLEREGGLVVQEICLVAPRMHEAMMQASRQRRHDLAHGAVGLGIRTKYEQPFEPVHKWSSAEKVVEAKEYLEQTIANSDVGEPVEKSTQSVTKQATEPAQSVEKTEVKPKRKPTRRKKTAKKADK